MSIQPNSLIWSVRSERFLLVTTWPWVKSFGKKGNPLKRAGRLDHSDVILVGNNYRSKI